MPQIKNKVEFNLTPFRARVHAVCRKIPRGRVATYQELARALNRPSAGRSVGNALHRNPFAPAVPCHRVVRSDGHLGGFARGPAAKARLLRAEGISINRGHIDLPKFAMLSLFSRKLKRSLLPPSPRPHDD